MENQLGSYVEEPMLGNAIGENSPKWKFTMRGLTVELSKRDLAKSPYLTNLTTDSKEQTIELSDLDLDPTLFLAAVKNMQYNIPRELFAKGELPDPSLVFETLNTLQIAKPETETGSLLADVKSEDSSISTAMDRCIELCWIAHKNESLLDKEKADVRDAVVFVCSHRNLFLESFRNNVYNWYTKDLDANEKANLDGQIIYIDDEPEAEFEVLPVPMALNYQMGRLSLGCEEGEPLTSTLAKTEDESKCSIV